MAIDDGCKLFVAGLPDSITEDVLRQLFEATGATIVEISVPRDRATGRPRGFAFVTLATEQQATEARNTLDNSTQSGRSISVRPFQSAPPKRGEVRERRDFGERPERRDRPERPDRGGGGAGRGGDDRTLYLGNLPYDASVSDVEGMLTDAGVGPIVRVTLPQDADGRPRGFGFVTLGSVEAAQAAVDSLSGVEIGGRRISASIARGRSERPARGPRPMNGPARGDAPRTERRFDEPVRERPPRAPGPPPDAMPVGSIPDEGRRGDGRRRKEKKKKKAGKGGGAAGGDRDEGRRDRSRGGGRRERWGDEDDY